MRVKLIPRGETINRRCRREKETRRNSQRAIGVQRYASWTNMIVSIVSESGVKAEGDVTCLVKFADTTFSEQN